MRWYVKDLSQLTGVSRQTLHHYDRIALLKPSLRLTNGYRCYSESDLLKLQQIIALKYFGFALEQIKYLLTEKTAVMALFSMQANALDKKVHHLLHASQTLKSMIVQWQNNQSIPWETMIQLIEVYRMAEHNDKSWVAEVLSPEEYAQYTQFDSRVKNKDTFDKQWAKVVALIQKNIHLNPRAERGLEIARQAMNLINARFGKEHAHLRHALWEKGFKPGKMNADHIMTPEIVSWLDQALDEYYRSRIYRLLEQVTANPRGVHLADQWQRLMEEMYGTDHTLKQALIAVAQKDERISTVAKEWLKGFFYAPTTNFS